MAEVKILFPSSIASFGVSTSKDAEGKVINESAQYPATMYGIAKASSERLGEWYASPSRDPGSNRGWLDFRAVRFPSVIGAGRGPGGTTAYSTLMVQEPLRKRRYYPYVDESTRLDILYIDDAIQALLYLYDFDFAKSTSNPGLSKRHAYNIAGIRMPGTGKPAPSARDIADAVNSHVADDVKVQFVPDMIDTGLQTTVQSFGILSDETARADWNWPGVSNNLEQAVEKFMKDINDHKGRIKPLELY